MRPTPIRVRLPNKSDVGRCTIFGVLVRPLPQYRPEYDYVMCFGRIMVQLQGKQNAELNAPVNLCISPIDGYIVGGFSVDGIAGQFIRIANARFMGPADTKGIVELTIDQIGLAATILPVSLARPVYLEDYGLGVMRA